MYADEEKIKSNIKILSILICVCALLLIGCVYLDKVIDSIREKEETEETEVEEDISLGEIEDVEDITNTRFPFNSQTPNLVGTTYLNLLQSDNMFIRYSQYRGMMAIDDNYVAYLLKEDDSNTKNINYNLVLADREANTEKVIMRHCNAHFLYIYNDFVFGVYDINYNESKVKDCVFTYNIKRDILKTYDEELGDNTTRIITSMIFDGRNLYMNDYSSGNIYVADLTKPKIEIIARIDRTSETDFPVFLNLSNNVLEIKTSNSKYYLNVLTRKMEQTSIESVLPDIYIGNEKVTIINQPNGYGLYLSKEPIYSGNINTINIIDDKIYFSDNNTLYSYYDGTLKKEYETNFTISQIYTYKTNVILYNEQEGQYEILR